MFSPRVDPLLPNTDDFQIWACIPICLGLIFAPLYDHRPPPIQTAIIVPIVALTWLWMRLFNQWMDSRIGISLRAATKTARRLKLGSQTLIWGGLVLVAIAIGVLRRHSLQFHPDGWMDKTTGVLLCMAMIDCLKRAFDTGDLRPRRIWNAMTAEVLLLGFSFIGTSPKSFGENLALVGVCYLALALLDVGLLLHMVPKAELTPSER